MVSHLTLDLYYRQKLLAGNYATLQMRPKSCRNNVLWILCISRFGIFHDRKTTNDQVFNLVIVESAQQFAEFWRREFHILHNIIGLIQKQHRRSPCHLDAARTRCRTSWSMSLIFLPWRIIVKSPFSPSIVRVFIVYYNASHSNNSTKCARKSCRKSSRL